MHDINVVSKEKIINIGKPPQARDLSPGMFFAISHKTTCIIDLESIYLSMKHDTRQHLWCRFCNYDTFREVLNVSSEWMVNRKELSMFVKRSIFAPFLNQMNCRVVLHVGHGNFP